MIKNRLVKKSQIFKGVSFAFAGMLALTMIPTNVFTSSAEYMSEGGIGSQSIQVVGAKSTADKGAKYEVKAAYFGSDAKIPVGLEDYSSYLSAHTGLMYGSDTISAITSNITVTYKPTGEVFEATKEEGDKLVKTETDESITSGIATGAVWGTMDMDYAGEYGINYSITITHGTQKDTFSTEYIVTSNVTSAYFEFEKNDSTVLPSVYDEDMVAKAVTDEKIADKNIYLPLPTLKKDETDTDYKENIVLNAEGAPVGKDYFVRISATGTNGKPVVVEEREGKYLIDAKYVTESTDEFAGTGNYVIKYSYYVGNQFVSSVTKTINVQKGYYTDYALLLTLDSTWQTSGKTNVEQTLPTISATTSANTNPARESVNISYTIKALRQTDTGAYGEEREILDGKFTPWADGYYRIIYTATDFYGNSETLTREIHNVRDTEKPVASMFDASNKENYVEGDFAKGLKDETKDASSLLKSKTSEGNIIIYAINATDNVKEGLKLSRTIRNSSTEIIIDSLEDATKNYAQYNLIFDYTNGTELVDKNYALKQAMTDAGFDQFENNEEIEKWLIANNYRIVVDSETLLDKTIDDGYIHLDLKLSGGQKTLGGSVGGITYTVYYTATDAANNESLPVSYDIVVLSGEFNDTIGPEITFNTQLKSSYRKNSVIVFSEPTASDDNDTRMEVITQYYYVKPDGTNYDKKTITNGEYKIDLSEIDEYASQGTLPTKLVIEVSAVDDYGNKPEHPWKQEISIVDIQDSSAPVIFTEILNTPNDAPIQQNTPISLPTITLLDDQVDYINSNVIVNRVKYDVEGNITEQTPLTVSGKMETRDARNGTYTLQAGTVIASHPGIYEVKVIFTDAGDNQITTFYRYEVKGTPIIEDPVITGLSSVLGDNGTAQVGEAVELGVPSVDYTIDSENYGIFGVKDDDSHKAYDYDITFAKKPESAYKFNVNEENTFTSLQPDIYKFQYNVRVSIFDKSKFEILKDGDLDKAIVEKGTKNIVVQENTENKNIFIYTDPASSESTITVKYGVREGNQIKVYTLSGVTFNKDDALKKLYITQDGAGSGTRYYLTIGDTVSFVTRDGKGKATFTLDQSANQVKLNFNGTEESKTVTLSTTLDSSAFETYNLISDIVTLTTKDTKAPEILTQYEYPTTMNKGETLIIKNVEAKDNSIDGINKKLSNIRVSHVGGDDNSFQEFFLDKNTGDIEYKINTDGRYTITYYVYDYYNNVNSELTYTIAVGDCQEPTITIPKDMFKEKYNLNDPLVINPEDIDFSDNDEKSDKDLLIKNLTVKLTNTSTGEVMTNFGEENAEGEEKLFSYVLSSAGSYKLEFTTHDIAGWTKTATVYFEVSTDTEEGSEVYQTIGIILIVVAVVVLVGVIAYFVISKIMRDRKAKGKGKDKDKKAPKSKAKNK